MSDATAKPALQPTPGATAAVKAISIGEIFLEFLIIGATSFGGGVVAYLRNDLVASGPVCVRPSFSLTQ
jgi:chromate transporter